MDFTAIFAIFGTIVCPVALVAFVIYKKGKNEHAERMKMIEQGMRPDPKGADIASKKKYKSLESGVFFAMVALGLFVGFVLKEATAMEDVLAFFISIPLFVGLGNIGLYLLLKKKEEQGEV